MLTIVSKNGDVLISQTQVIAHQVNCKGVMGSGVAGQIRNKWPKVFEWYSQVCKHDSELLGSCQMVPISSNQYIANLFGQNGYGRYGRHTDYDSLRKSLEMLKKAMNKYNLESLSIPYGMSCGLGGGNWEIVLHIIEATFIDTNFTIEIWKLE